MVKYIIALVVLIAVTGCDPVHDLQLENQIGKNIDVIYSPYLDDQQLGAIDVKRVEVQGQERNRITLKDGETIRVGTVTARYIPSVMDIDLDYLEIRYGPDTIKLTGKRAILSTFKQVEKLDWRIIII